MTKTEIENISNKVLKKIKPTDKKLLSNVDKFLAEINESIKKQKINAIAVVGGSISKDTFLKGDHDCDVFIKFNYTYKNEDLSKLLEKILKPFKPTLVHGSRDYYHILKDVNYEIVPVLNITNPKDAVNVTDMSPLHTSWVNNHKKYQKDIHNQIRIAKQFCKANRVYGAESYISGFSGHVLDILTIHYKGFENLLKASQTWKAKEIIDTENYYKDQDAIKTLNRSKIDSPIIVIDPVLGERNAAAALSEEKLIKFRNAAKEFLNKPKISFFEKKDITSDSLQKKAKKNKLILLEATSIEGKEDIIGAKLMKAFQTIRNQLKFHDFDVKEADWEWDKNKTALFWFILEPRDLFPITKRAGPPLNEKDRVKNFKEKHDKTFIDGGRICTYTKRVYTKADNLVRDVIKDPLVSERVKKIVKRRLTDN